jgi:hypothetical protein
MVKYVLTSPMFEGDVTFIFSENGYINTYINSALLTEDQQTFLISNFPFKLDELNKLISKSKSLHLREVPLELTFTMFWDKYNYKSDKYLAEKIWNKMSKKEQLEAYEYIPFYHSEIARTGASKKYPKTYLNQKPWIK